MDDMLAVRTLAERLLGLPHHSDAEAEPVRVLAGALPNDLPCAVPLPEGVTVIGSVSYPPVQSAYDQRGRRVTIPFDTALQPEEVMAYYQDRLRAGRVCPVVGHGRVDLSQINARDLPVVR